MALGNVEEALRGRHCLLRGRVAMFRRNERVVALCDRDRETAARDFEARLGQRLTGLRAFDRCPEKRARRHLPTRDGPLSIEVDAVVGDETARRQRCVALGAEILRGLAERRQQRGACLHPIFARDLRVGRRRLELRVESSRSFERVLERDDRRWASLRFGLRQHQRRRLARCGLGARSRRHKSASEAGENHEVCATDRHIAAT